MICRSAADVRCATGGGGVFAALARYCTVPAVRDAALWFLGDGFVCLVRAVAGAIAALGGFLGGVVGLGWGCGGGISCIDFDATLGAVRG